MAGIADIIKQQVLSAAGGSVIPANVKDQVVNGLSQSVLGSLTQTVSTPSGVDQIKALLSGKTSAVKSPVTALAGSLFTKNVLSKLSLGTQQNTALSALIPTVMSKLSGAIKDMDGDGDVDFTDIILSLKGGASGAGSLLGAAGGILGSILGK